MPNLLWKYVAICCYPGLAIFDRLAHMILPLNNKDRVPCRRRSTFPVSILGKRPPLDHSCIAFDIPSLNMKSGVFLSRANPRPSMPSRLFPMPFPVLFSLLAERRFPSTSMSHLLRYQTGKPEHYQYTPSSQTISIPIASQYAHIIGESVYNRSR